MPLDLTSQNLSIASPVTLLMNVISNINSQNLNIICTAILLMHVMWLDLKSQFSKLKHYKQCHSNHAYDVTLSQISILKIKVLQTLSFYS